MTHKPVINFNLLNQNSEAFLSAIKRKTPELQLRESLLLFKYHINFKLHTEDYVSTQVLLFNLWV